MPVTDELYNYLVAHGTPPDDLMRELTDETLTHLPAESTMQIGPDEAALLTLLTKLLGVRTAVEVGTFTGMSSLSIARGLADGGKLICCDVSEEYTSIARRYWARAGVADRVELRLGPAADTLRAMPAEPHVDLAFIDADKPNYIGYYERLLQLVRHGGLIAVDNTLALSGQPIMAQDSESAQAMRVFNELVHHDERVDLAMLTIGEGLTLLRVR